MSLAHRSFATHILAKTMEHAVRTKLPMNAIARLVLWVGTVEKK